MSAIEEEFDERQEKFLTPLPQPPTHFEDYNIGNGNLLCHLAKGCVLRHPLVVCLDDAEALEMYIDVDGGDHEDTLFIAAVPFSAPAPAQTLPSSSSEPGTAPAPVDIGADSSASAPRTPLPEELPQEFPPSAPSSPGPGGPSPSTPNSPLPPTATSTAHLTSIKSQIPIRLEVHPPMLLRVCLCPQTGALIASHPIENFKIYSVSFAPPHPKYVTSKNTVMFAESQQRAGKKYQLVFERKSGYIRIFNCRRIQTSHFSFPTLIGK